LMFLFEYARGENLLRVIREDGNDPLADDGTTVESFIDEVNRTARPLDAVFKYLSVCSETRKCRQQTRMNIQDAVPIGCDEITGEKAHIPGKTNNLDLVMLERGDDLLVVLLAASSPSLNNACRQAPPV